MSNSLRRILALASTKIAMRLSDKPEFMLSKHQRDLGYPHPSTKTVPMVVEGRFSPERGRDRVPP